MQEFFEALFGDKPPEHFMLTWEKKREGSSWFTAIPDMVSYVKEQTDHDIWVGVGASPQDLGPNNRCKPPQITGIPGLWLDLDTKHPVHQKENLPETEEQVQQILSCMPFDPSVIVNTGHGRQYYWLFKEFWTFDTPAERTRAANLSRRLNYLFRDHAQPLGFAIDSTFNLDRVLRIPGTFNCKDPNDKVQVNVMACNDLRYDPDVIEDILPISTQTVMPALSEAGGTMVIADDIRLDPDAVPPFKKMEALKAAEPDFARVYAHDKKGLKKTADYSASSFDMSLASHAFQAGWTDQEIVNLLICFRATNKLPPKTINDDPTKPLRLDYYRSTLLRLRNGAVKQEALETLGNYADKASAINEMPKEERVKALRSKLTDVLGIPIIKLIRYKSCPESYRIVTPEGERILGPIENITNQRLFINHIASLTEHLLPKSDTARWHHVQLAILAACENVEAAEEDTENGRVAEWLRGYLHGRTISYDLKEAQETDAPFVDHDHFFIFAPHFKAWLRDFRKDPTVPQHISLMLTGFGFSDIRKDMPYKNLQGEWGMTQRKVRRISVMHPFIRPYVDFVRLQTIKDAKRQRSKGCVDAECSTGTEEM